VLPQQLKLVLQGLRSLPRLTVGAYERANRVDGLEAASVMEAIASATRRSGMAGPRIVDRILLPLVDADRRPPGKARPQSVTELANVDLDTVVAAEALKALADREIVRCSGDPDDPNAPWQLDHDYLARPILRLKRQQGKWQVLLAERAKAFSEAGGNLGLRWRGLLSLPQQAGVLLARVRGQLCYGNATGFALASLLASAIWIGIPAIGVTALGWAAWQFNEATRIEATISGLSWSGLTKEQRPALLDLAHGSGLARWIVTQHTFTRPQLATVFSSRPDEVFLALTGLDPVLARRVVVAHVGADTVNSIDPALRDVSANLAIVGG
jgi:hypothetical protein